MAALAIILSAIFAILLRLLYIAFKPGLRNIPGPFFAKFTDLWRLMDTYKGRHELTLQGLHRRYGTAVRIGPNIVSISDPAAIENIYGVKTDFIKSDMYTVMEKLNNGKVVPTLTTLKDRKAHAAFKRPVAQAFTVGTLAKFEPFLDKTIRRLVRRLGEDFGDSGRRRSCGVGDWVQYFSFDVISEISFGRSFGFLETGLDLNNLIHAVSEEFRYIALVSQMPLLDYLMRKNPISTRLTTVSNPFAVRASQLLKERMSEDKASDQKDRRDFVSYLQEYQKDHPGQLLDRAVFGHVMTNLLVGSDSTSVAIRAVIYYVLRTPGVMLRLRNELDSAELSYPVSWHISQTLTYLDAVIKEALRLHPPGAILSERVVPPTGLDLPGGRKIPPGTIVGMNGWNILCNTNVFGLNAEKFDPERWLQRLDEDEDGYCERVQTMKRVDLTFGHGPRSCIGKPIALMEIYKLAPTLFGLFDIELADPEKEWEIKSSFFAKQYNMNVKLSWRRDVDSREQIFPR